MFSLGPVADEIGTNLRFVAPFFKKRILGGDQGTEPEPGLPGKQGDPIQSISKSKCQHVDF